MKPASVAKFLTSLAGVAGIAITIGLATGDVAKWLTLGIAAATAIAVYLVPNSVQQTVDTVIPQPAPAAAETPSSLPKDQYPPV
jgi:hypothetical protein